MVPLLTATITNHERKSRVALSQGILIFIQLNYPVTTNPINRVTIYDSLLQDDRAMCGGDCK